jgi:beta-lactamase superfamily II metal-dependent hydrolase
VRLGGFIVPSIVQGTAGSTQGKRGLPAAAAPRMMRGIMHVNDCAGRFKTNLVDEDGKRVCTLLWGDPVKIFERRGDVVRVRARRQYGWLPAAQLSETGLLEIYVIDVGQGDGVLLRTPHDDAWHLVDAGVRAAQQMTRKGAANFLRWKFLDDLQWPAVKLRNMVMTHPDGDHFGGLIDVLAGALPDGRRFAVDVENFWHGGMARFAAAPDLGATRKDTSRTPQPHAQPGVKPAGSFIVELLEGAVGFASPARAFVSTASSNFAELARLVGSVPRQVGRLQHDLTWLPGYGPQDGPAAIRVLGPIVESLKGGGHGLRTLGAPGETRNGHSVVLRVDYGKARILLTGDLNTASQRLLMSVLPAAEFEADVAKGCHHGSDDVDLAFVRAMAARATVVSSGDNEDYAHPRPRILGASARYGRESVDLKGVVNPPLLYSTELARSVGLDFATRARKSAEPNVNIKPDELETSFTESAAGPYRRLSRLPIATDLVYGLVNVRTDGERIMMAYMKEGSSDFDLQLLKAGTAPA